MEFPETIRHLEQWNAQFKEALGQSGADAEIIPRKRECEAAIRLLKFAEQHGITSAMRVHRLPEMPDAFGGFHILWNADSCEITDWREPLFDGKSESALPGDLLLCHTQNSRRPASEPV